MPILSFTDDAGEIRWSAKAANHRTTADSAEGYKSKFGARDGLVATLRSILATTNADLAGGPLEGVDVENLVRLVVADYLARQSTLLVANLVAEHPEMAAAVHAGARFALVDGDVLKDLADALVPDTGQEAAHGAPDTREQG